MQVGTLILITKQTQISLREETKRVLIKRHQLEAVSLTLPQPMHKLPMALGQLRLMIRPFCTPTGTSLQHR